MSLNQIPRDKNGKPLRAGQWVRVRIKSPPSLIHGRIMYVGREKSYILPYERRGDEFKNLDIEIVVDI